VLLAGKIVATSLTIAIGGSGGVFAPSLFMGAMLGSAYGAGIHHLLPAIAAPAGTYGLVGMGAVFAAAARAPITAVIIIFELTGDYRIILPLMFAIALAAGASRLLCRETIYTLKLRRRGIDVMRGRGANLMQLLRVAEAMQPLPASLPADATLNEAIARLSDGSADSLPVVDAAGVYRGTVSSQQLEQAMRENALDARAGDLAQPAPVLTADQTLEDALAALLRAHSGLPVVTADDRSPVGWLSHIDVLRAYNERLEQGIQQVQRARSPARGFHDPPRLRPALARLRGYRIVDLELATNRPPVGSRIGELAWPGRATVLAIRRGDRTFQPGPQERLEQGDRLTVLVTAAAADHLADALTAGPRQQTA
jgi:CIC family chloride channel protein